MATSSLEWFIVTNLLPDCYMPLAYNGYYWHLKENELYSFKNGKIRKLVSKEPFITKSNGSNAGYTISNQGTKILILKRELYRKGIEYMAWKRKKRE